MGFQGGGDRFGGPREMHKATRAECKKECEVPFKPSGERPVYCRDCFSKRKDSRGR
jgi:CxxC-x17-CxxC domain-containing protein